MFQCHSPKSSHPRPLSESKSLFYTSGSLLLSCIQGYRYHLSKFFTTKPPQKPSVALYKAKLGHRHTHRGFFDEQKSHPNLCLHLHMVSPICLPGSLYKGKYRYRHAWGNHMKMMAEGDTSKNQRLPRFTKQTTGCQVRVRIVRLTHSHQEESTLMTA